MSWTFDNNRPIYIQIAEQIEQDILSGKLPRGGKIPSVREYAVNASVNPNTMQRAMQELESKGLILTVQRTSGRQVTDDDEVIESTRNRLAAECVREFISQMKDLGFTDSQIKGIVDENW